MKYYNEINDGCFLPIVNRKKTDYHLDDQTMPRDFFDKYNELFDLINCLNETINDVLNNEINFDEGSLYLLKNKFSTINNIGKLYNDLTIKNLEVFLCLWGDIFDLLYFLEQLKISYKEYINIMKTFNDAVLEISYKRKKIVDYKLPNTWFITSKGFLYNVCATLHSEGPMQHYVNEFNFKFLDGDLCFDLTKKDKKKIDVLPDFTNSSLLDVQGYVRFDTLDVMLHYIDYVKFNHKIFDSKYINIVQGMLEIRKDYYNFLKNLYRNTTNPIDELIKIIELTANNYDDILIRCCGCSKITSSPTKTIVTSRLDYGTVFKEYIKNGWNISFLPPLIINEHKGIIEEYDGLFKARQFIFNAPNNF